MPAALRSRLQADHGLSLYDADVIVTQGRDVADYFLDVASAGGDAKQAANWVTQHVLRVMNAEGKTLSQVGVSAARLAGMIAKLTAGALPSSRAREVFEAMLADDVDADEAMAQLGIAAVDESELVTLCGELLAANPKVVADVQGGKQQAVGAVDRTSKETQSERRPWPRSRNLP